MSVVSLVICVLFFLFFSIPFSPTIDCYSRCHNSSLPPKWSSEMKKKRIVL